MSVSDKFFSRISKMTAPAVLEIGTRGWGDQPPRHHRDRVIAANRQAKWTGLDAEPGPGVDVVADAHELSKHFPPASFDALICAATLEHLRRPWIAVREMASVVKSGGIALISTHQTFVLHGYPSDYFRFSREAIAELFAADAGWEVVESIYEFPCKVIPLDNYFPHANNWNFLADGYLNVAALAVRI